MEGGGKRLLTARGVDGVPQLSVLPLAQLVLLGACGSFGGLYLGASRRGQTQTGQGGYHNTPRAGGEPRRRAGTSQTQESRDFHLRVNTDILIGW